MTKLNADILLKKGIQQVIAAGIVPGNINPSVKVNSRAKTRFGKCKRTYGRYDFEIELNAMLLQVDEKKAMNTMVHEILHTCSGCLNHGRRWTSYARRMNNMFGYNISRTTDYESFGLERPKPKYIIECKACSLQFHRFKRSKVVTHTSNYTCKCGGKLKLLAS